MYSVYILGLSDGSYYIGSTSDLIVRLQTHCKGRVRSTKSKLPCELLYTEGYPDRSSAQKREYQIKKWKSRNAIEKLLKNR